MDTTEPFQNGARANAAVPRQTGRPARILIADDEPILQQFYANVLTSCGYEVDAAKDGATAWEALRVGSYDLLITDNNMPKVSGLELVEKLRAARMTLPTILASGALPMDKPSLKISATLLKPISPNALLETVQEVLRTASHHACAHVGAQSVPAEAISPVVSSAKHVVGNI